MVSKKELRQQVERIRDNRNDWMRNLHRLEDEFEAKEGKLIALKLIPKKYRKTNYTHSGTPRKTVNWDAVEQAVKDLAAYRAAERGKEIAGD